MQKNSRTQSLITRATSTASRRPVRGSVVGTTEQVDELLDEADESASDALAAVVEYNEGWQLYAAQYLRNDAPALSDEISTEFDELIGALQLFRTVQAHFKTIYFQRELTRFSQLTIYFGIFSVLAAVLLVLLYGDIDGITINTAHLPYVTSLLATVVFVLLLLLSAFILRTAALARRTAEVGVVCPQKHPGLIGRQIDVDHLLRHTTTVPFCQAAVN